MLTASHSISDSSSLTTSLCKDRNAIGHTALEVVQLVSIAHLSDISTSHCLQHLSLRYLAALLSSAVDLTLNISEKKLLKMGRYCNTCYYWNMSVYCSPASVL